MAWRWTMGLLAGSANGGPIWGRHMIDRWTRVIDASPPLAAIADLAQILDSVSVSQ